MDKTTTIYSPHVLVLEGIFALHDQRVLDMLDVRIFTEADSDLCLARRCECWSKDPSVPHQLTSHKWCATSRSEAVISKAA